MLGSSTTVFIYLIIPNCAVRKRKVAMATFKYTKPWFLDCYVRLDKLKGHRNVKLLNNIYHPHCKTFLYRLPIRKIVHLHNMLRATPTKVLDLKLSFFNRYCLF